MANVMQGQGIERKANPVVFAQYTLRQQLAPLSCCGLAADAGEAMAHDLQPEGTLVLRLVATSSFLN